MWFVNDSLKERYPGDVSAFASEEDMLLKFEYWFAEEPHLVFNELGEAYKFISQDEILSFKRRSDLDLDQEELATFMAFIEKYQIKPREVKPVGSNPVSTFLKRLFPGNC